MRLTIPALLFPAIKVPTDQTMQFAATCNRIVDSTVEARREFVERYHRQLDVSRWELVKRRVDATTDLAVFKPNRASRTPRPAITVTASPILIGVGSMQGSLDDIMLGMTATTTSTLRTVTSLLYSNVADARVLTRMDTPTEEDPFAFLGIKWVLKTPSLKLTPLARARDFVYLESSGVRYLHEKGESRRVGFQLIHSVDLTCFPSLPVEFGVVRGHMSFCFLFVENLDGCSTEIFCKGFVDPRCGLAQCLTISAAVDVILNCSNAIASSNQKKIEWRLREHQSNTTIEASEAIVCASGSQDSERDTYLTIRDDSILLSSDACEHCHSRHRRRGTIPDLRSEMSCSLCGDRVCSHCSHQVRQGTERQVCCAHCLERTHTVDAYKIARDLAQRAMAFYPQERFPRNQDAFSREKMRLAPIQKRRHTVTV